MHFLDKIADDLKEEVRKVVAGDVLDYKSKYNTLKDKISDSDVLIDICTFLKVCVAGRRGGRSSKRLRNVEEWKEGGEPVEEPSVDRNNTESINSASSDSGFVDPVSEIVDSVSEMNLPKKSEDEEEEIEKDTIAHEAASDFFDQFPNCLSILILGETGVGKSTFINGLVNYLKYGSIEKALRNKVEILIKAYFTHTDEDYNRMRVECEPTMEMEHGGDQENERTIEGQSSTQSPKSYVFSWGPKGSQKANRTIDTPGVGDVCGVDQEKLNFSKILDFIADFSEIHATCILLHFEAVYRVQAADSRWSHGDNLQDRLSR